MNSHKYVLLTGAGFTHNFGAPLAADLWGRILGHPRVQASPRVQERLREEFDFEAVYHEVLHLDKYDQQDRDAVAAAVEDVNQSVDETVRRWVFSQESPHPVNINALSRFIDRFAGSPGRPGYFFTLNQDLFVERHYLMDVVTLRRPMPAKWRQPILERGERFTPQHVVTIQEQVDLESALASGPLHYVKLHGSWDWRTGGGAPRMVIGRGKADQIEREPLLKQYFELFEGVVRAGGKRLLVCGYSFRDPHVNRVIARAITEHGLKLFILSPQSPAKLKEELDAEIWRGLCGYFRHDLLAVFPKDQADTLERSICRDFFGS